MILTDKVNVSMQSHRGVFSEYYMAVAVYICTFCPYIVDLWLSDVRYGFFDMFRNVMNIIKNVTFDCFSFNCSFVYHYRSLSIYIIHHIHKKSNKNPIFLNYLT